jgi:uncharacterized protein (DUF697 family)
MSSDTAESGVESLETIPEQYRNTLRNAMQATLILGPAGDLAPVISTSGMIGVWTSMIVGIADKSGHKMSTETAMKLAGSIIASVVAYRLASSAIRAVVRVLPGLGKPTSVAVSVALNTYFTYRLGRAMIKQFESPSFDMDSVLDLSTELAQMLVKTPSSEEFKDIRNLIA